MLALASLGSSCELCPWQGSLRTGCVDSSTQPRNPGKGHASRVTNLLACSSAKTMLVRFATLEEAAVRQVCLTLPLMRLIAQPCVRNWNDRAQELRLLPRA